MLFQVSANGEVCVCGDQVQKPFPLLVWDLINRKLLHDLRMAGHEFLTRMSAITNEGHYVVCVCKVSQSHNTIYVSHTHNTTLYTSVYPHILHYIYVSHTYCNLHILYYTSAIHIYTTYLSTVIHIDDIYQS